MKKLTFLLLAVLLIAGYIFFKGKNSPKEKKIDTSDATDILRSLVQMNTEKTALWQELIHSENFQPQREDETVLTKWANMLLEGKMYAEANELADMALSINPDYSPALGLKKALPETNLEDAETATAPVQREENNHKPQTNRTDDKPQRAPQEAHTNQPSTSSSVPPLTESDSRISPKTDEENTKVFSFVDQMPQFPGGESALMKYIADHLQYPAEAINQNIQGLVMLRFVVTGTGEVGEVQVQKSLAPSCDREAVRVVKSLPRFTPGRQQGKPVNVWYHLPVRFQTGW